MRGTDYLQPMNLERSNRLQKTAEFLRSALIAWLAFLLKELGGSCFMLNSNKFLQVLQTLCFPALSAYFLHAGELLMTSIV